MLDTNLLLLWLVGSVDERLISKHKATSEFKKNDFYNLQGLLVQAGTSIVVTPHILAETSNLLSGRRGKTRLNCDWELFDFYSTFLKSMKSAPSLNPPVEHFIDASELAQSEYLSDLGLTDAGLLNARFKDCYLLTADGNLYRTAERLGHKTIAFQLESGKYQ